MDIQNVDSFLNCTKSSDRERSIQIDLALGYKIDSIESQLVSKKRNTCLVEDSRSWIGLHPQIFLTPYPELVQMMNCLKPFNPSTFLDIGAGYGRMAFVQKAVFPLSTFTGLEFIEERVQEAKRIFSLHKLADCSMQIKNVLDSPSSLPVCDVYFIYDFSNPIDLRIILDEFDRRWDQQRVILIAKGKGIQSLIQLEYPQFWRSNGRLQNDSWTIYSSYLDFE